MLKLEDILWGSGNPIAPGEDDDNNNDGEANPSNTIKYNCLMICCRVICGGPCEETCLVGAIGCI